MRKVRNAALLACLLIGFATLPLVAEQYRDEFHKTYPVAPNVTISLSNVNGSVEITGWDKNEVQLDAEKSANSQEKVNEAEIRVTASANDIHIETHYANHLNNNPATVKYQLHVPRGASLEKIDLVNGSLNIEDVRGNVRGASVNGSVSGHGLTGDVDLSTVNGSVTSELIDMSRARHVKLASVNGHVELAMPKDANAHLEASTVSGSISSDFDLPIHHGWVGSNLDTTLGSGATHVELSDVNGSIKIHGGTSGA